jgi:hypothetical protein
MKLQKIRQLIELHNGKFTSKSKLNKGTENEIIIAYKQNDLSNNKKINNDNTNQNINNVILFEPKNRSKK